MNLVLIHGRAQQGRPESELWDEWIGALKVGYGAAGVHPPESTEIFLPLYGDCLNNETTSLRHQLTQIVEMAEDSGDEVSEEFVKDIVREMAEGAGIDPEEIARQEGEEFVEHGPGQWKWVQAVVRKLEELAPWIGDFGIGSFTADVQAYLMRDYIRSKVHKIVAPEIKRGPCVVVSHSLGTVIAYLLLRELNQDVPLLVTVGSPLGVQAILNEISQPLNFPDGVRRWMNFADKKDFVAIHSCLKTPAGIENNDTLDNVGKPHAISRYLAHAEVAGPIARAL